MRSLLVLVACAGLAQGDTHVVDPEVRALVDKWLAAQNGGDFAAYQQLYASRFTGVRRSGPRVVRFDRAGWMNDRQRMFGKKMVVGMEKLAVTSSPQAARATFVQSFEQGSYKDRGDKQLVMVREGGALKIAQEEMLSSTTEKSAALPPAAAERFAWTVDGNIVLDDSPGDIGRGKIDMDSGAITSLTRAVDPKLLPAEVAAWKGRKVTAFSLDGQRCDGVVKGFRLIGKVTPHFSMQQEWRDKAESKAAREAWELASKVLVGVIEGCDGAAWARAASLPAPSIVTGREPDDEVRAGALKKFRALPEWKTIQKSYLEQPVKGVATWEEYPDGKPAVEVVAFDVSMGGKPVTYVSVSAVVSQGCADFAGDLWALWALRRDKGGKVKWTLENTPGSGTVRPAAFVDTDGDGVPEILFDGGEAGDLGTERGRVKLRDGKYDDVEKLAWPFLDCPC